MFTTLNLMNIFDITDYSKWNLDELFNRKNSLFALNIFK